MGNPQPHSPQDAVVEVFVNQHRRHRGGKLGIGPDLRISFPNPSAEGVRVLTSFNKLPHLLSFALSIPQVLLNALLVVKVIGDRTVDLAKHETWKVVLNLLRGRTAVELMHERIQGDPRIANADRTILPER